MLNCGYENQDSHCRALGHCLAACIYVYQLHEDKLFHFSHPRWPFSLLPCLAAFAPPLLSPCPVSSFPAPSSPDRIHAALVSALALAVPTRLQSIEMPLRSSYLDVVRAACHHYHHYYYFHVKVMMMMVGFLYHNSSMARNSGIAGLVFGLLWARMVWEEVDRGSWVGWEWKCFSCPLLPGYCRRCCGWRSPPPPPPRLLHLPMILLALLSGI